MKNDYNMSQAPGNTNTTTAPPHNHYFITPSGVYIFSKLAKQSVLKITHRKVPRSIEK